MICKDCVHYGICEYSTIVDKEIKCKNFIRQSDYVDVVRCKDCKLWDDWHDAFDRGTCNNPHFNFHHSRNSDRCWHPLTESNWFCSYGERK